ncbi:MAG: hypothetical protein EBX63_10080 [Betaproteobacteria bacterium]|nr:hypothetical protein [Betaproteobacteria bacterium]
MLESIHRVTSKTPNENRPTQSLTSVEIKLARMNAKPTEDVVDTVQVKSRKAALRQADGTFHDPCNSQKMQVWRYQPVRNAIRPRVNARRRSADMTVTLNIN